MVAIIKIKISIKFKFSWSNQLFLVGEECKVYARFSVHSHITHPFKLLYISNMFSRNKEIRLQEDKIEL